MKRLCGKFVLCIIILQYVTACSLPKLPNLLGEDAPKRIDQRALSDIAASLSEQLISEGIDTVAVMDFTTPEGNNTPFEQAITERMFLAMAGFSGKIWVRRGSDMNVVLENTSPETEAWRVMGIKAVLYGTVTSHDEMIALSLRVTNAETSALISEREEQCPMQAASAEAEVSSSFNGEKALPILIGAEAARSRDAEEGDEPPIPTFPWPPAFASASTKIPSVFLVGENPSATLSQVAGTLENALDSAGYIERSYYAVPNGFALVTHLEQVDSDGTPKPLPDRWAVRMTSPKVFSLASYLQALFAAQSGHFRIIAFVVTSAPFAQNANTAVTREEAMEWFSVGTHMLPGSIGNLPYSERHYCAALIYEFEQPTPNHEISFKMLSALSGIEHLKKAQIWEVLEQ